MRRHLLWTLYKWLANRRPKNTADLEPTSISICGCIWPGDNRLIREGDVQEVTDRIVSALLGKGWAIEFGLKVINHRDEFLMPEEQQGVPPRPSLDPSL